MDYSKNHPRFDDHQIRSDPPDYGRSMTENTFRTSDLTKTYRTGDVAVHALRGVNLTLPAGEMSVLLGSSGSGKSTLLNILGGLDVATSGQVWFRDQELTGMDQSALTQFRRRSVGFVFQFYNLVPSLSARENVALVTEIAENPMKPEDALARVGLEARMDHFPAQLSGGEQQRVALARAFASGPSLLFADEPTGSLDSATGERIIDLLFTMNRAAGATLVLVTHDSALAQRCSRQLSLHAGQIDPAESSLV